MIKAAAAFAAMALVLTVGSLIIDFVSHVWSGGQWQVQNNTLFFYIKHELRITFLIAVLGAVIGALVVLPDIYTRFRYYSRYCQINGLTLKDLSNYSDGEIDQIVPELENFDTNARVYYDDYVFEYYFESKDLLKVNYKDRFKISEYQYYRVLIGKLSKEKLLAKAKKKHLKDWPRPTKL